MSIMRFSSARARETETAALEALTATPTQTFCVGGRYRSMGELAVVESARLNIDGGLANDEPQPAVVAASQRLYAQTTPAARDLMMGDDKMHVLSQLFCLADVRKKGPNARSRLICVPPPPPKKPLTPEQLEHERVKSLLQNGQGHVWKPRHDDYLYSRSPETWLWAPGTQPLPAPPSAMRQVLTEASWVAHDWSSAIAEPAVEVITDAMSVFTSILLVERIAYGIGQAISYRRQPPPAPVVVRRPVYI